jgi:hypothetical protein
MNVSAATPEDFAWLAMATGCAMTSDFKAIKAVDSSGKIRGMVGYCLWTRNAVQCHMAVDHPIVWRSLLKPAFEYPFEQADKGVILGIIPEDNLKSRQMATDLGFTAMHTVANGHAPGVGLVVFEMTRAECKWIRRERKAA